MAEYTLRIPLDRIEPDMRLDFELLAPVTRIQIWLQADNQSFLTTEDLPSATRWNPGSYHWVWNGSDARYPTTPNMGSRHWVTLIVTAGAGMSNLQVFGAVGATVPIGTSKTTLLPKSRLVAGHTVLYTANAPLLRVDINLFDSVGRLVRTETRNNVAAGQWQWRWDGRTNTGETASLNDAYSVEVVGWCSGIYGDSCLAAVKVWNKEDDPTLPGHKQISDDVPKESDRPNMLPLILGAASLLLFKG